VAGVSLIAALIALAVIGGWKRCGPSGYFVSGRVTWKDQPLDQGFILFEPSGPDGLPLAAEIAAGRYELPSPPGLALGRYDVQISSARRVIKRAAFHVEVRADGPRTFDFSLD
jgi:hypothetical protein